MRVRRGNPDSGKIRVLYVAHGHTDFHPGGGELAAFYNYKVFRRSREYEAFFAARADISLHPHPGTLLLKHEKDDHAYFLCTNQHRYDSFFESFLPETPELFAAVLSSFRSLLTSIKPDIVHFHHYHKLGIDLLGYVRKVLPDVRIVMTLHEFLALCPHFGSMLTRSTPHRLCEKPQILQCMECFPERSVSDFVLRSHLMKKNLDHVDLFVAPSRFLKERYEDWGIEKDKMIYLDYGRPIWDPVDDPREKGHGSFVVSFFGQIVFHKGFDVFVKAAREYHKLWKLATENSGSTLPEVRFVVYGKFGDLPEAMRSEIDDVLASCSEVITYNGQYDPCQMPKLMAGADAVVVPSIWWENAPLVIQEAFMAKKPVICSNIGGCAERVEDRKSGLHFLVGDHFDLLSQVLELARSRKLYDDLVAGIPEVLSEESMYEVLDGEYRRLLNRGTRQGSDRNRRVDKDSSRTSAERISQ